MIGVYNKLLGSTPMLPRRFPIEPGWKDEAQFVTILTLHASANGVVATVCLEDGMMCEVMLRTLIFEPDQKGIAPLA